jgi:hypothetical protein
MLALSIRQPYAELILRGLKMIEYRSRPTRHQRRRLPHCPPGLKTIEYRSRPTHIIGERFYIYAAGKKWLGGGRGERGRGDAETRGLGDF